MKLPTLFRLAKRISEKSNMNPKVGAVLHLDKQTLTGYNKEKTHPKFANPEKHIRKSLHAELDCLSKCEVFPDVMADWEIYVYREVHGKPAMARPCNHCMKFIRESGIISRIYYTIPHEPFWESEEI